MTTVLFFIPGIFLSNITHSNLNVSCSSQNNGTVDHCEIMTRDNNNVIRNVNVTCIFNRNGTADRCKLRAQSNSTVTGTGE